MALETIRRAVSGIILSLSRAVLRHRALTLAAAAFLLALAMGVLRPALVIFLLIALASLSLLYNRVLKDVSLGIELVMLATVVSAYEYGGALAALVGFVSLLTAEILSGTLGGKSVISFFGIVATALLLPAMKGAGWSITAAGIASTVLYDLIILPLYLLTGSSPWKSLLFVATHLLFNTWVFLTLAPLLQQVIG